VVVHDGVDAMIADVGDIQNEAPWERLLDSEIPGFDVRILEVLIYDEIVHALGRIADDAVTGNDGFDDVREAIFESCGLPAGKHRGAETGDGRVESVVGTHGKIVGVAVVRERCEADAEARANHGRVFQTVSKTKTRSEILVVCGDAEIIGN